MRYFARRNGMRMRLASFAALSLLCCLPVQEVRAESASKAILPPFAHTLFCIRYPKECDPAPGWTFGYATLRDRRHQLDFVQNWINAKIAPKEVDPRRVHAWSILPSEGNCTDYAVSKRHILLQAGWPASSLLLAEVTVTSNGEHHLILIARGAGGSWVLDNLRSSVVSLEGVRNDYIWRRIQTPENPKLWTTLTTGLI
jgi:predicted transglutaminase-like cysteine proteinase